MKIFTRALVVSAALLLTGAATPCGAGGETYAAGCCRTYTGAICCPSPSNICICPP